MRHGKKYTPCIGEMKSWKICKAFSKKNLLKKKQKKQKTSTEFFLVSNECKINGQCSNTITLQNRHFIFLVYTTTLNKR